jgi:ketosteroid isomerase-like protein
MTTLSNSVNPSPSLRPSQTRIQETDNNPDMHPNQQLITSFYEAFQQKDIATMQACYADDATFTDEVFRNLNAAQTRKMWEMLIRRGKDLTLAFADVQANDTTGSATWVATYTFSQTKRQVVNHVTARFLFKNGKISQHTDHFDFYTWSRQALGLPGLLLGWTGYLRKKVQQSALKNLTDYMNK